MKKLALPAIALLSLALCAPASANHRWGNYHWAQASTSNPSVEVQLGNNLLNTTASKWKTLFSGADNLGGTGTVVFDWTRLDLTAPSTFFANSAADILDTPWGSGANLTSQKRCKPVAGRIEVCNARYGMNGWLGLAQIWTSGGHIVQGTAKMNDSYFDNTRLFPANNQVPRQHVLCQEVGHGFGLGHQDESGKDFETCMDYDNENDNPAPNQHDNHTINQIYHAHNDVASSTSSTSTANRGQVRRLGKDLYVEDLGGDERLFTFVTWVDAHTARSAPNDRAPE